MNLTKSFLLQTLVEDESRPVARAEMEKACNDNVFYVDAIAVMCGDYSIGSMGSDGNQALPNVYATLEAAQADNQEMVEDYEQQIKDGERDEDDEYEGFVMKASITGDDEISLYQVEDDIATVEPAFVGSIRVLMGY